MDADDELYAFCKAQEARIEGLVAISEMQADELKTLRARLAEKDATITALRQDHAVAGVASEMARRAIKT